MKERVRERWHGVKPQPTHRVKFGKFGESLVLGYYMLQGWWPMARPRHERVQTDLVLKRGNTLVLIEVKTRRRPEALEKVLHHAQRQRLAQQVKFWAARAPHLGVRLDVVVVTPVWPWLRVYRSVLG